MLRFLLTRLSLIIPTFIGMTLVAFFLIRLVPGDPIETLAGERGIDAARHAELLHAYGLDRPILVQYGIYIGRVLQGDLGKSIITHEPVLNEFLALIPDAPLVPFVPENPDLPENPLMPDQPLIPE